MKAEAGIEGRVGRAGRTRRARWRNTLEAHASWTRTDSNGSWTKRSSMTRSSSGKRETNQERRKRHEETEEGWRYGRVAGEPS